MDEAYESYRLMYHTILRWLLHFINAEQANVLARRACATFVEAGLSLHSTHDGPLSFACNSIRSDLERLLLAYGESLPFAPLSKLIKPSNDELHELNRLYVALYHLRYDAQMTWRDCEDLRLIAASFSPIPLPQGITEALSKATMPEAWAVRRLVTFLQEEHSHGGLCCGLAEKVWIEEDTKSFNWDPHPASWLVEH